MDISPVLINNVKYLKKSLSSKDVSYFSGKTLKGQEYAIVFIKGLTDKEALSEQVIKVLSAFEKRIVGKNLNAAILSPEKKEISSLKEVISEVVSGSSVILVNGLNKGVSVAVKKFEKRVVSEPPTATVVKGPREGFVESLETNISLIRRRLKTPSLVFEKVTLGKYSKTEVAVCYIKDIARKGLKEKIISKLKKINIDAVLDSSYIAEFLAEHPTSLFKQVGTTEKPDIFTSRILEGRVGIIVDGSPILLTLPYLMLEDLQSAEDYYMLRYRATIGRILRVISVFIAVLLPSFFVSAQLFHLQLIPLPFLLTIVNSIKGIPLSPSYEMFFTLLVFEILNEASVRMPKYVGMVVSIVGALVLGETAVNAGIISAPALMIIALSGICLYTVPELEKPFSIIRVVYLFVAGSVGIYGLLLCIAGVIVYLTSFENFGVPILSPFSPLIKKDLKDGIVKSFLPEMKRRPLSFSPFNKVRLKKGGEK